MTEFDTRWQQELATPKSNLTKGRTVELENPALASGNDDFMLGVSPSSPGKVVKVSSWSDAIWRGLAAAHPTERAAWSLAEN